MTTHFTPQRSTLLIALSIGTLACIAPVPAAAQAPAAAAPAACSFPSQPAATLEETAWRIFVAANCFATTAGDKKLVWETWTEQNCWYQPGSCQPESKRKRFSHAVSLLGTKGKMPVTVKGAGLTGCAPMTTTKSAPTQLAPFVPANLSNNPQFCEEVYVNAAEAGFINAPTGAPAGVNLATRTGQAKYMAATKQPLNLPASAIEVKVDWIAATSLNAASAFNCTDKKPAGVYTQTIDGVCYAMVGIHISSKLFPNWLWATFEPQSALTNPNRCNPKLYSSCNDPWGSNPASSAGPNTAATKNLTNLMDQAGLAPEFRNYRLVGVQTDYDQPVATKGMLGNSFVEFNAQVLPQQASCITCHAYAAINITTNPPASGTGGPLGNGPFVGKPVFPPVKPGSDWKQVDFSWMLGFMPGK